MNTTTISLLIGVVLLAFVGTALLSRPGPIELDISAVPTINPDNDADGTTTVGNRPDNDRTDDDVADQETPTPIATIDGATEAPAALTGNLTAADTTCPAIDGDIAVDGTGDPLPAPAAIDDPAQPWVIHTIEDRDNWTFATPATWTRRPHVYTPAERGLITLIATDGQYTADALLSCASGPTPNGPDPYTDLPAGLAGITEGEWTTAAADDGTVVATHTNPDQGIVQTVHLLPNGDRVQLLLRSTEPAHLQILADIAETLATNETTDCSGRC